MDLFRLALRNISGHAFRSWVVALCALLISSLALATSLILMGAESSLRLAIERLGADLIIVPGGTSTRVETALLMGHPTKVWMPSSMLDKIAAVPGIQEASPQLYLASLTNASCCSVSDMFLIVYDPSTDFVVRPWLEKTIGDQLHLGEVIGGSNVFVPQDTGYIKLYGYHVHLRANMEPTGTGLDQSMFLTMETAQEMARISLTEAVKPLEIPQDSISAIMVKLEPGYNPYAVALEITDHYRNVDPIVSPDLFQTLPHTIEGTIEWDRRGYRFDPAVFNAFNRPGLLYGGQRAQARTGCPARHGGHARFRLPIVAHRSRVIGLKRRSGRRAADLVGGGPFPQADYRYGRHPLLVARSCHPVHARSWRPGVVACQCLVSCDGAGLPDQPPGPSYCHAGVRR